MGGRSTFLACGNCAGEMRTMKNGIVWVEYLEDGITPYKAFAGDLCECKDCGNRAIHLNPREISAKHDAGFNKVLESARNNGLLIGKGE